MARSPGDDPRWNANCGCVRGDVAYQGPRFLLVSLVALGANLLLLRGFVAMDVEKVLAQAIAVALVMPLNFVGNKLWSFRHRH